VRPTPEKKPIVKNHSRPFIFLLLLAAFAVGGLALVAGNDEIDISVGGEAAVADPTVTETSDDLVATSATGESSTATSARKGSSTSTTAKPATTTTTAKATTSTTAAKPATTTTSAEPATTTTTARPATTTTTTARPATTTTTAPPPPPPPPTTVAPVTSDASAFLACVRYRESRGNYSVVSSNGLYFGAYQFARSTWDNTARYAGRTDLVGVPPNLASPGDQDAMALALYRWQGTAPWGGYCA
jgi:cytoskeletal protein RodZ